MPNNRYFWLLGITINFLNITIMKRTAKAHWKGNLKEGKGEISTPSSILNNTNYSFKTRFDPGVVGTNPEELIAAAHAGCFTMKLSFVLGEAGFTPEKLETKCDITLENGAVTKSHLTVTGTVPGITEDKWQECVKNAKENCPISKLLTADISADASLS